MSHRSSAKLGNQSGISHIELLVVIMIISIVAALAMLNRGSANEKFQRQNVARELKVAFERARFDSVKRRADVSTTQAFVEVSETSFRLRTDRNQDGVLDAGDDLVTNFPQNISISGEGGIILPVIVTFSQRGEPAISGGLNPSFLVCNFDCSSPGPANADRLIVTPTGTVNLLSGSATPHPFGTPGVTTVGGSVQVSNRLYIEP